MKSQFKKLANKYLIPKYDEASLFIMAVSFLILLVTDQDLQRQVSSTFSIKDPRDYLLALFIAAGIGLSLFHMFSHRDKSKLEKSFMLLFAVSVNCAAGIIGGGYLYEQSEGYLTIFPILNIINGVTLFVLWRNDIVNESHVSDANSSRIEVFISIIAVLILFIILQRIYELYWAVIFSMCVFYATSINTLILSIIGVFAHNKSLNQTGANNAPPG